MDRRVFLQMAAAVCGCGACGAQASTAGMPCALNMGPGETMPAGFVPWKSDVTPVETTSGNPQLDAALGVLLVQMSAFFEVRPEFGFIEEENGPNAYASNHNLNGHADGTVAFGRQLLKIEMRKPGGDFSVMAICAHEFGHVRQFRDRMFARIRNAGLPVYCSELHADFLAGAFVAFWKTRMRPADLLRIGDTWRGLGSTDFNDPGSHGTMVQRVDAIEAGFFHRDANPFAAIGDIMEAGFDHVSRYRA